MKINHRGNQRMKRITMKINHQRREQEILKTILTKVVPRRNDQIIVEHVKFVNFLTVVIANTVWTKAKMEVLINCVKDVKTNHVKNRKKRLVETE